jgi:type II secretory pathway component GspD/PulD (secretin)
MKTLRSCFLIAGLAAGVSLLAADPPTPASTNGGSPAAVVTNGAPTEDQNQPPGSAPAADAIAAAVENGTNGLLRLNFRSAPLNLVLDYLSDAAGFIINKETDVKGTVDAWSKDPVTKDEAVELLNANLRKNGYAVVRNGRILNIISMENAKTSDLEIDNGNKWEDVEKSDEVVTQIIPVRYASASQLMNNLQVLLPTSANLSVNESANSLILVATKRDIRRMLKIVSALDSSIANVSSIQVFLLRYADAKQLATVIQQLFTPQGANQGPGGMRAQIFNMMRGGGPGGFGGAPGGASNSGTGNATKVTAAADDYSNSLIVSAPSELMATISNMVHDIDQPITSITELRVFTLHNADPTELADQLTQLFPDDSKSTSNQNQGGGGFRFFGGRGPGAQANTTSDRNIKKSRVLAVADPRTSALIVSAPSELMPQIADMVDHLDLSQKGKEIVKVWDLQNADPQDVSQVFQDLFQRTGTIRANNNNNRNSLLGTGNPLTARSTQQQQTFTTSTGFGTGTTGGRGGMNTGF